MLASTSTHVAYRLAGHTLSLSTLAGITLAVALAALLPRPIWRIGRIAVTAVHESGHALVAVLSGRRVTAVHLRADASGVTMHQGPRRWGGQVMTALAGYPAPGLAGVIGAWLIAHRQAKAWLIALLVLGVVNVLLWVRNLFGLLVMVVWVAALGWLANSGTRGLDAAVGAVVAWYLVIGGFRAAVELWNDRGPSDAADLGRLFHLPAGVGKALFFLVAAAELAAATGVLFWG